MIKLKTLREQNNLTQRAFAEKLDVTHGAIGMWETGKRDPDIETLIKMSDFFGVSIDYLVGHSNEPYAAAKPAPADEYSDEEKRLVGAYRVLPEGKRLFLLEMIEKFAAEERGSGHGNKSNRA